MVRCVTQTEGCPVTARASKSESDLEDYGENARIVGIVYVLWKFVIGMRGVTKTKAITVGSSVGENRLGEGSESGVRLVRDHVLESIFVQSLFDGRYIVRLECFDGMGDSGTPLVNKWSEACGPFLPHGPKF